MSKLGKKPIQIPKDTKVKVDGATLSISKTIEILTNVEVKKLNGKMSKEK